MRSLRTVTDRGCGYAMNMFLLLHSTITEKQSKISPMSPHTDSGGFSAGLNPQTRVAYRSFDTQTLGFLSRSLPSLSELKRRSILSILQWNGRTIQDLGIVSSLIPLARYNDVWELGAQRSCNGATRRPPQIMAPYFVARKVSDEIQRRLFAQNRRIFRCAAGLEGPGMTVSNRWWNISWHRAHCTASIAETSP
jgi:hypothetical protein